MRKAILAAVALAICGCGLDSNGTSAGGPAGATASQTSRTSSYPVRIVSQLPNGAVQLRLLGADVEGDPVFTDVQAAATTVTVQLPPDVTTLRLDYLDGGGTVVATFVESAKNLQEHDFSAGIIDPALVPLQTVQARAEDNPVVGANVKFSFAFFGCGEAVVPGEDIEGQLNQNELEATTNVAQLRQHLADIRTLQPGPKYVFLCGDMVQKPETQSSADLVKELTAWHKIRAHGPLIIDQNGQEQTVAPAADGSVFPSELKIVTVPGHHEMCYGPQDLPNRAAGDVFAEQMADFIRGANGPKPGDQLDDGGLGLPPDQVARDESKLSYTFQDGENFFMVVNTDTYVGDGAENAGHVPLRWVRKQLAAAQQDTSVKHIFVFGHRPLDSIYGGTAIHSGDSKPFYQLLNNPGASSPENLKYPDPNTKVRGYFCAHAHLMSSQQPADGTVAQLVCGGGGSQPDPPASPYPWYGFGLVGVNQDNSVDSAFIGRNVHRRWADQEALKLRGPNISGPGPAEAKTPKMVARLYPRLLPSFLQVTPAITYNSTFTSDFISNPGQWQKEAFIDPAGSPLEYKTENVEFLPGGGVRLKVAGKHQSSSGSRKFRYYSGRLRSNFRQQYGLFLFRATVPKGKHIWPALWTVGNLTNGEIWPQTGEIDVMETVLTTQQRPDFTSRIMARTKQDPFPTYTDYLGNPWYASLPADHLEEIKTRLTAQQWAQPHTFAVDWYKVLTGDALTDVRYDFYLDVAVDSTGRLVNAADPNQPPNRIHSYSLRSLINTQNQGNIKVPELSKIVDEWTEQAFVLNVAVGGAWDPELGQLQRGEWDPPTDGSADMVVNWVKCYQRATP